MSVIELLAWPCMFISGLSFGFVLGVRYQHHRLTREVNVHVRDIKPWLDRWGMYVVGVLLILIALLTYQSQRASNQAVDEVTRQSACLTTYANRLYDSLTPRQHANEQLQRADQRFKRADQVFAEALGKLLSDALAGRSTEAQRTRDAIDLQRATEAKARALAHANAVSDRLNQKRAENPYPLPPKAVCP